MLNTLQVRALARAANIKPRRTYTDRTLKRKSQKANPRRSVVFMFYCPFEADAAYAYLSRTLPNPVTRTSKDSSYASRTSGGEYVRVIANIA